MTSTIPTRTSRSSSARSYSNRRETLPGLLIALILAGCQTTSPPPASTPAPPPPTIPDPTAAPTPDPALSATTTPDPSPPPVMTPERLFKRLDLIAALPDLQLDVELFYAEHWMSVKQTVVVPNQSGENWTEVVFNIPLNHNADAFYLDEMRVTLAETIQEGPPALLPGETTLRVPLPRPAQSGERVQVEMAYRVLIPPVTATAWPPLGTTGFRYEISDVGEFALTQAGEWYPALAPYQPGEGWQTWQYRPVGDPTIYPLVNTSLNVKTDSDVVVVSGGAQQTIEPGEDGTWRFFMPAARGVAFLASPDYRRLESAANGIPVVSVFMPQHEEAGQAALEVAVESIQLYEKLYGPYPYESLVVAENGFFGGMEYSGLITITDYAYLNYGGKSPSLLHALVSHETAHQWWYGAVGSDQPNEPWLDESLAFYSELLYFEYNDPESTAWWWERRVNVYQPHGPVDASIYSYADSADFITSVYGQAARFLRDLREQMGDDRFFAFLRDYYATYSGQFVTGADFKQMAQEYAGVDLQPLFEAYFAEP
jgi:hypothetical protein